MDFLLVVFFTVLTAFSTWRLKRNRHWMVWAATGLAILGFVYSSSLATANWQKAKEDQQHADFMRLAEAIESATDESWLRVACPDALKREKEFRDTAAKRGESFISQPRISRCRP